MNLLVVPWPDAPVMAAIITALALAFGAWLTWLASGARELRARLDVLENRVSSLEAEKAEQGRTISAMASFINRLGAWLEGGMKGRRPKPSKRIHDHIDVDPWDIPTSAMTPYEADEEDK